MKKTCSKCKEEKELECFVKRSDMIDGYKSICKTCINKNEREKYRIKNNIPLLTNIDRICKECGIVKNKNEFSKNIKRQDGLEIRCVGCFLVNKENVKNKKLQKRIDNGRDFYRLRNIKYRNKNRLKVREKRRVKQSEKLKTDLLYNLKHNITSSINQYLKSNKTEATIKILGCSIEEFKVYIESKFEVWMTWDNRGRYTGNYNETWQIDHIIPISSASTDEEVYKLSHYTNLQPLCSRVNLEKGNKQN